MRTGICSALAAFAVLALTTAAVAQDGATISGSVTDQAGDPLAGATIQVVGTNIGTLANQDGRYLLQLPASRVNDQQILVRASLIGRASDTRELTLTAGTHTLDFVLGEDPLRLEELVVTGQGTARQREKIAVTVSSIDADDVIDSQESNIVAALAGKAPNVKVTTSGGEPGSGSYIQIRGQNTIFGSTQPLFVVDGTPINNDSYTIETTVAGTGYANRALDINPDDIESIEVLRGPAAGAIYGSRAASGVVLITTKQGRPGTNRWTYKQVVGFDEVNESVPLQTSFGQGIYIDGEDVSPTHPASWGEPLPAGTPVYDHASQIFRTGLKLEEDLTFSGGSDRTTYYLSLGRTDHEGVVDGNSSYESTQARLRGSHSFTDNLTISGNIMYTDAGGDMIQQGSNISGIMLAALRSPPEFDSRPYLDPETGLHRSYRYPNPTELVRTRGYDNPFWIANELLNTTDVNRTIGQAEVSYDPFTWLNVNYLFGVDHTSDDRFSIFPKSSSDFPEGRMIRANFLNTIYDSNLILTAERTFSDAFFGSLTVGQNINVEQYQRYEVDGFNLIQGANQLDFTVDRSPNEFKSEVTTQGYFTQANVDLWDQLFLTGTVRADAASTFGSEAEDWYFYPQATVAWDFTRLPALEEQTLLSFGKLRFAFGRTGRQPPIFSNITGFTTSTLTDGWLNPNGLQTIYQGLEGVHREAVLGFQGIEPETTTGVDVGLDLSFLQNRVNFSATYYDESTDDIILDVPVPTSTGFASTWRNAAAIENDGWELTLGLTPVRMDKFSWTMDAQWATNNSCVTDLAGAEFVDLGGFTGSLVGLYRPDRDEAGNVTRCYEYNTFYGDDFVRFGRGTEVGGVDIDNAFSGWSENDLYIGEDGFPIPDSRQRAFGNANPDWTGSFRSTFTFGDFLGAGNSLRASVLFDASMGSDMWNGTKGALYYFGTHADTEEFHGDGGETTFEGVGPGAGTPVTLDYSSFLVGPFSGFTGPFTQFLEDASYVKLRDISLSYAFDTDLFSRFGMDGIELQVSGRNLYTWTDYTGIDPESNLTGQTAARGLDYFNLPRTRSVTFTLTLNQ